MKVGIEEGECVSSVSVSGPCPLLTAWPRVGCGSIGDEQEEKEVDYDMKACQYR